MRPLHPFQYRDVFDRVQDIVYVRDLDGVILDINYAGARFFGRAKETLIGETLHQQDDDAQARSLKATNELLFEHGLDRSTVELQNAQGETRILEATTTLMRDDDGRPLGAYGVMRDVTESIHLQRLMAADNDRKSRELEDARKIHQALLPKQVPRLPHLDIAVRMRTATEVGGDYYDFSASSNGILTIALGDATGHGLKAGIFGVTAKSYFQTLADRSSPREILEAIAAAFRNLGIPSLYMCLMLLRIHDRQASVISAGMPAFFLRPRGRAVERIEVAGTPLGMRGKTAFDARLFDLDPGTTMLLFSDGLPEMRNTGDQELGEDAIRDCFAEAGEASADAILERVLSMAEEWSGGRAIEDDVTVMVVRAT